MKTSIECIPCFLRQALNAAKLSTDDSKLHNKIIKETLKICSKVDYNSTPPEIGQKIYSKINKLIKNNDPYSEIKNKYNTLILKWFDDMKKTIKNSSNQIVTAIKYSIAGNIIDFGTGHKISETTIKETINYCLNSTIDKQKINEFINDINKAKKILYLGDNAGEIIFDRLLIEQMPMEKITFAVRGAPIINDITRKDADISGISNLVKIIDNGWNAPGTVLDKCSADFQSEFDSADLIISKGQGNYETLNEVNKNIYFILKVKCDLVSNHLNLPIGSLVFEKNTYS